MSNQAVPFKIEYNECYVDKGDEATIYAEHLGQVHIVDIREIGPQLRIQYAVIWCQDALDDGRTRFADESPRMRLAAPFPHVPA